MPFEILASNYRFISLALNQHFAFAILQLYVHTVKVQPRFNVLARFRKPDIVMSDVLLRFVRYILVCRLFPGLSQSLPLFSRARFQPLQ